MVGYHGKLAAGSIGALVLVVLTLIGVIISMLPVFNKLPLVFWVSIVLCLAFQFCIFCQRLGGVC